MATKRYRMRFDFQLNVAKDEEYAIAEQISYLKSQGRYSRTVRDGIRLVSDLHEGNLDVLFDLFPWVRAEFVEYVTSVQPQKSATETNIQQQLARIEELLATSEVPSFDSGARGPKPLQVPEISAPRFEDMDELLIVKQSQSDGSSAQNFLDSAFGLIQ